MTLEATPRPEQDPRFEIEVTTQQLRLEHRHGPLFREPVSRERDRCSRGRHRTHGLGKPRIEYLDLICAHRGVST